MNTESEKRLAVYYIQDVEFDCLRCHQVVSLVTNTKERRQYMACGCSSGADLKWFERQGIIRKFSEHTINTRRGTLKTNGRPESSEFSGEAPPESEDWTGQKWMRLLRALAVCGVFSRGVAWPCRPA